MNHNLELKLQAWLDDELSSAEARSIAQEISNDAAAEQLAANLRALKSVMRGSDLAVPVPETREFYFSKIQRQIEREERVAQRLGNPRRASLVRWLSSLAGFASLASILVLAVRPLAPPAFDETSTGDGMEAVTFHDQSAGLTVVWLADNEQSQQPADSPDVKTPDLPDSEGEME